MPCQQALQQLSGWTARGHPILPIGDRALIYAYSLTKLRLRQTQGRADRFDVYLLFHVSIMRNS